MTLIQFFTTSQIAACARHFHAKVGMCMRESVSYLDLFSAMCDYSHIRGNCVFSQTKQFTQYPIFRRKVSDFNFIKSEKNPDLARGIFFTIPTFTRD